MKRFDWFITLFFLAMGLLCMTFSATSLMERPAAYYVKTFFSLCAWISIPLIIAGTGYYLLVNWQKKKK